MNKSPNYIRQKEGYRNFFLVYISRMLVQKLTQDILTMEN